MVKLTKEQLKELYGFDCGDKPLKNGQVGYCKEEKTVVTCCSNCGDYLHVKNVVVK